MREECLICKGLLIYNEIKKENAGICSDVKKMEHRRFELPTSTMRMWRAPNCANAPKRKMEAMGLEPMTSRV